MQTAKKKYGTNLRDIRTYIMSLIYRNGYQSVRVPSSTELAEKFSVTRRTARVALERLISEGYLIGRKGVGTFTNPNVGFRFPGTSQQKLIGIGTGSCNNFYYDCQVGKPFAGLISGVCTRGFNVFTLTNMPQDKTQFYETVSRINLDAVIVYCSELTPEVSAELRNNNIPFVAIRQATAQADFVEYDFTAAVTDIFDSMKSRGATRLTQFKTAQNTAYIQTLIEMKQKVFPECRLQIIDAENVGTERQLEELFTVPENIPDHLVCSWRSPELIAKFMKKYNVSAERCHVTVDNDYVYHPEFRGSYFYADPRDMCRAALEMIEARWENPDLAPQKRSLKISHLKYKTNFTEE